MPALIKDLRLTLMTPALRIQTPLNVLQFHSTAEAHQSEKAERADPSSFHQVGSAMALRPLYRRPRWRNRQP